jgi:streptomycin 3"-adenylyltransferase
MDPAELLSVIDKEYQHILGENLCGIYVHGSLAFGCFNWNKSDIDILVVVYKILTQHEKESCIRLLLRLNPFAPPKGFEMSVVLYQDCRDFNYPTPYQLHFSNSHIMKINNNLSEYCRTMNGKDPDLAAHFTIVKKVGIVQYGKPIEAVFGEVPESSYSASIRSDIENAETDIAHNPVYTILNLCRVLAYKKDGLILSKLEGGNWGIDHLPKEYADYIKKALDCYSADEEFMVDAALGQQFACHMKRVIFNEFEGGRR